MEELFGPFVFSLVVFTGYITYLFYFLGQILFAFDRLLCVAFMPVLCCGNPLFCYH